MFRRIVFMSIFFQTMTFVAEGASGLLQMFQQIAQQPANLANDIQAVSTEIRSIMDGNTLQQQQQQQQMQQQQMQQQAMQAAPPVVNNLSQQAVANAGYQACVNAGTDPAACALLNPQVAAPPAAVLPQDDAFVVTVEKEMKALFPGETTVSYLDLNYSDLIIVSFLQMIYNRMSELPSIQSQDVPTLTVVTTGIKDQSSLISKANLPKATTATLMSPATIAQNVMPRFPKITFSSNAYSQIYSAINLTASPQKGGVLLVFTQPGITPAQGRIRIIPHPSTQPLLGKFVSQVGTQLDLDLENAAASVPVNVSSPPASLKSAFVPPQQPDPSSGMDSQNWVDE